MVLLTLKKWLPKPIEATAECQILKQLYIINLHSFLSIIIYTILLSITNSLGTVVAQPLLHLTVPHGSRSSIAEPTSIYIIILLFLYDNPIIVHPLCLNYLFVIRLAIKISTAT